MEPQPISDELSPRELIGRETVYEGRIWNVVHDTVQLSDDGSRIERDYIVHPGAVSILALDERERVLLVNQYRHPVGMRLWELPAGLLDVAGEPPLEGAKRELWEEADRTAESWAVLTDVFLSPGSSSEALRIFLARDVNLAPEGQRHERTDEEAEIITRWVPLDEAVAAVLDGRIHNPSAVVGLLAAFAARASNYSTLRPADSAFDAHPGLRGA
ncbi:NUDIX domain-containing protein [Glutamicibacter bergerei]|uniref:NUDIX domain-containing protein n=2 Tax=Glutamicibacter TaxID=1742989 RepID=A0ABV9MP51_9MICC|nr:MULTISPECIES: NUDIX hydrolase [Glutamicibacter]PCC31380.1 ADP-ribose pyrophosphatase [Glutamicibacter sp. BW77]GGJ69136.1 NTP pyrophosphohydrolase [Glutamicibacter ardleyensis]HBV11479.1 NUDIX hydrolase [Micrococcaceae bacterium]